MTLLQSIVPGFARASRSCADNQAPSEGTRSTPSYNISENDNAFAVVVQLPGVAKDGLEVTANDGELTIVGRREWHAPAEWTALHRESEKNDYELTLAYSDNIDAEKISAELKNGVVTLTLPKAEAAKPRKIAVA